MRRIRTAVRCRRCRLSHRCLRGERRDLAAVSDPQPGPDRLLYAGDLWAVPRAGGDARRLTAGLGIEIDPVFSPDGRWIAFAANYDGNPTSTSWRRRGECRAGSPSIPAPIGSWAGRRTASASSSARRASYARFRTAVHVSTDGGLPSELPLPHGRAGRVLARRQAARLRAALPTGRSALASAPGNATAAARRRRSGSPTCRDSAITQGPARGLERLQPDVGRRPRLLPLRPQRPDHPVRLRPGQRKVVGGARATTGRDIKSASAGPGGIVYDQFGALHLFDPASGRVAAGGGAGGGRPGGGAPELREGRDNAIQTAGLSPTGARAVFEARGEILTVPAEKGDVRNLTNTPGAAERDPAWSPDGKSIAYFSDESGEYELHLARPGRHAAR